jgi:REP element-mobilizing transposase RayT
MHKYNCGRTNFIILLIASLSTIFKEVNMPQMARLESPGALAHIMARGIDGCNIFRAVADREEFLTRFSVLIKDVGYKCLAWCLMDNHYHLFLRCSENPMSRLMRPLNSAYARWYNKKYERKGYLFQDRFKSVLCQDMDYAKQLIRYIHLNPVRAQKVPSLAALKGWPWCGHAFLIGDKGALGKGFQDRTEALRRFSTSENKAIRSYLAYLEEGIDPENARNTGLLERTETVEITGAHKGWPAVIGDPEFVREAMEAHRIGMQRKHRKADYHYVLAAIEKDVSKKYVLKPGELLERGRRNARAEARAIFCFRAHHDELIPFSVIARYLRITIPPASLLYRQGRAIAERSGRVANPADVLLRD